MSLSGIFIASIFRGEVLLNLRSTVAENIIGRRGKRAFIRESNKNKINLHRNQHKLLRTVLTCLNFLLLELYTMIGRDSYADKYP
jgi:hypothetical protein